MKIKIYSSSSFNCIFWFCMAAKRRKNGRHCFRFTTENPHAIFVPYQYVLHYGQMTESPNNDTVAMMEEVETTEAGVKRLTKQDIILNFSGSKRLRQTSCKDKVHRTMIETRSGLRSDRDRSESNLECKHFRFRLRHVSSQNEELCFMILVFSECYGARL